MRELDLEHRLFRYPVSYLIYSESFDALPKEVKHYVYRRVRERLESKDETSDFPSLGSSERDVVLQILQDTTPDFPSK